MKTFTQRIVESSADYLREEYRQQLIGMLTNAYKEEINAFYYYFVTKEYLVGVNRKEVEEFFEEAAKDELYDHAAYLLKRIAQLGGMPIDALSPANVVTAKHPYISPGYFAKSTGLEDDMSDKTEYGIDVVTAVNQNIEAEKGAIETYRAICDFTQSIDIVTHKEVKRILEDEVEHLQELYDFKADLDSMNMSNCGCSDKGCCEPCNCEEPCSCDPKEPNDEYDIVGAMSDIVDSI